MAGGIPKYYPLRPPNWHIDPDELAKLFSDKTRMVLLNTPHNPIGKVFSRAELQLVADLCQKYDVIAVSDEVYEHIVFDDHVHVPLAMLDGMRERTLTIGSAGKTFSTTGWKVGWIVGHPDLIKGAFRVRQWTTFAGAAPFEEATAVALELALTNGYYGELKAMYQAKRDLLVAGLENAGIPPLTPAGTYFIMADISGLGFESDVDFCRHLVKNVGVAAIPPSAFYSNPADGKTVARFAFCKRDDVLQEAISRLSRIH
jgi:N-succinyldiaminopimelate aminotransferase